MIDAFLHRYGGNLSFLKDWTWDETLRYIPKALDFVNDDILLLRWIVNYETLQSFFDFRKSVKESASVQHVTTEEIEKDVEKIMRMEWREADGEWN